MVERSPSNPSTPESSDKRRPSLPEQWDQIFPTVEALLRDSQDRGLVGEQLKELAGWESLQELLPRLKQVRTFEELKEAFLKEQKAYGSQEAAVQAYEDLVRALVYIKRLEVNREARLDRRERVRPEVRHSSGMVEVRLLPEKAAPSLGKIVVRRLTYTPSRKEDRQIQMHISRLNQLFTSKGEARERLLTPQEQEVALDVLSFAFPDLSDQEEFLRKVIREGLKDAREGSQVEEMKGRRLRGEIFSNARLTSLFLQKLLQELLSRIKDRASFPHQWLEDLESSSETHRRLPDLTISWVTFSRDIAVPLSWCEKKEEQGTRVSQESEGMDTQTGSQEPVAAMASGADTAPPAKEERALPPLSPKARKAVENAVQRWAFFLKHNREKGAEMLAKDLQRLAEQYPDIAAHLVPQAGGEARPSEELQQILGNILGSNKSVLSILWRRLHSTGRPAKRE